MSVLYDVVLGKLRDGKDGQAATISVGGVETLPAGSTATVTNEGTPSDVVLKFGIPRGDAAATISVGTVTTGLPGSTASVTNSGSTSAVVLDFIIPRGDKGDTGSTATISVGTVTTGLPGSTASVTNSGSTSAAVLDFIIPRGDKGVPGGAENITTIPDSTSEYTFEEGTFKHAPETAPTYTLPAITDTTVTHTIFLSVDMANTASIVFQDSEGTAITPSLSGGTPAVGDYWQFMCEYSSLQNKWLVLGWEEV